MPAKKSKPKKSSGLKQPCIFCGGDATKKSHRQFCTGIPSGSPPLPPGFQDEPAPPPIQDEPYDNPGKGYVLTNDSITGRVAALFQAKPFRESRELNELVGWQFSQAVYALRQRGWRIQTLKLAPKRYAYQLLMTSQEAQPL